LPPQTCLFDNPDCLLGNTLLQFFYDKLQFIDSNFKSNNRIFAQKGVFVFGNKTIDNAEKIKILKKHKKLILQELSAIFSIDEKSLFQDIYGFSMVNDVKHPIYEKTAIRFNLIGFFISLNCLFKSLHCLLKLI
jgi:hypothetical protein